MLPTIGAALNDFMTKISSLIVTGG